MKIKDAKLQVLLWSIAFPGFGQILNGKLLKGMFFILLEFLININGHINLVIVASFHGEMQRAVATANYQWLMFYPCIYMFAIWDSYKDAGGGAIPFACLPFVFAAYSGTIGVIYSPSFSPGGFLLGPVFGPILFMLLGVLLGVLLQRHLQKAISRE
ncbi:MAG: hypothetical protein AAGU23_01285 [Bacillota bacterium]